MRVNPPVTSLEKGFVSLGLKQRRPHAVHVQRGGTHEKESAFTALIPPYLVGLFHAITHASALQNKLFPRSANSKQTFNSQDVRAIRRQKIILEPKLKFI